MDVGCVNDARALGLREDEVEEEEESDVGVQWDPVHSGLLELPNSSRRVSESSRARTTRETIPSSSQPGGRTPERPST